jgi:hypothetical protein
MKSVIHLFTAVLALTVVQQASADLTIRLTGSTAFRAGTHKAIVAMMGGEANCKFATAAITGSTSANQTSYESADYSVIRGTATSIPGVTTVHCTWTGSATGIKDVAQGNNLNFIPASSLPASNGYANATVGNGAALATESTTARMAFSDVFQSSTPTPTPALQNTNLAIIPFSFVANEGTTGITNMTQQLSRALFSNGSQPKKLFTGNPGAADADDLVLAVGRDNGSGTRITQLAETQYGVFTPVQQWKLTNAGSIITTAQVWPIGDGVGSFAAGNGGYTSGSTIRNFMGFTSAAVDLQDETGAEIAADLPVSFISWLGITDANTAVTNGAVRLSYEGVTYDGSNPNLIYEGLYTGWGYLHLYNPSGLSTDENQFKTNLATQLDNASVLGSSGLRVSQMHVSRSNDGATVGP